MTHLLKRLAVGASALALAACGQSSPVNPSIASSGSQAVKTGNGAPSGAHYTLNIIGVPRTKSADMTGTSGHRIFVSLSGNTKINLTEGDYLVLDANGTDGTAAFQLPNPDPDGDGTTVYSVFARALGKPGGSAIVTTCAFADTDGDGVLEEWCSTATSLTLTRSKGKSTFSNVSKELLYLYVDLDGDGNLERYPLFDDALQGYFWDYENSGLKLAQFRFYPCSSTVPDPSNPGGTTTTTCFN